MTNDTDNTRTPATVTSATTTSENDRLFDEWKSFLQQNDRVDLLLAATEAVTQLHPNMLQQCIQHDFIPLLVKHISYSPNDDDDDDDDEHGVPPQTQPPHRLQKEQVSVNALRALVYLSSTGMGSTNQCIYDLITVGKGMNRMIEIVLSNPPTSTTTRATTPQLWSTRVNFAMALIANMTRTELGAVEFIGHTLPDEPIYHPINTGTDNTETSTVTTTTTTKVKPTLELLLHRYLNPKYVHDEDVNYHALLTRDNEADDDDDEDDDDDNRTRTTAIVPHISSSTPSPHPTTTTSPFEQSTTATLDSLNHDPYQHFAAILLNITAQSDLGRQFILQIHRTPPRTATNSTVSPTDDPEWTVLQLLLGQLKSRNPLRRRGVAGMIRNICQNERDSAWWLLHVVQLTVHLLYPLAGPEELDYDDKQGLHVDLWMEGPYKLREPDHITRLFLVEAILFLLSTGRASRDAMRLQRTYVILKMADLVEEFEDVSAIICDCVNYLRRDEQGTAEGSSDTLIEETYQLNAKVSSAADAVDAATPPTPTNDDDDFDNVD